MPLRSNHTKFLENLHPYYHVLFPKFKPLLTTNPPPIIAIHIQNHYRTFRNHATYLPYLRHAILERGIDLLLFTSHRPTDHILQ
ncbi:beta-galactosidase, partial [Paenibacillus xylanexedens]|uniref:beta-galactosidase n=1 Tax=Paenibacillus xylanexedens TaxID=528191 RepID=UPI0034D98187